MSDEPENKRRDQVPVQEEGTRDDKNEEPKKLNHGGLGAFTPAPAIVREAPPASPLRFYARLRHQLESRGIDYDDLPRLTEQGKAPPCFSRFRVSFDAWLASASMLGATVPYRYDMPAEPNYCWDCTKELQAAAKKMGLCQFPHVRFEAAKTLVPDGEGGRTAEVEWPGVSRPTRLQVDLWEAYETLDGRAEDEYDVPHVSFSPTTEDPT